MKLYATVTSERASKGQGGNEFIQLEVQGTKPYSEKLLDIHLKPDEYGHAYVIGVSGSISLLRAIIDHANGDIERQLREKSKGEKQKDEKETKDKHVHYREEDIDDYCPCGYDMRKGECLHDWVYTHDDADTEDTSRRCKICKEVEILNKGEKQKGEKCGHSKDTLSCVICKNTGYIQ